MNQSYAVHKCMIRSYEHIITSQQSLQYHSIKNQTQQAIENQQDGFSNWHERHDLEFDRPERRRWLALLMYSQPIVINYTNTMFSLQEC